MYYCSSHNYFHLYLHPTPQPRPSTKRQSTDASTLLDHSGDVAAINEGKKNTTVARNNNDNQEHVNGDRSMGEKNKNITSNAVCVDSLANKNDNDGEKSLGLMVEESNTDNGSEKRHCSAASAL